VNNPAQLATVLTTLESIQATFNASATRMVSLADLIVLAGGVGVEQSAKAAGFPVVVPFAPGRVDALEEQTDAEAFSYLEPVADGFRNYSGPLASLPAEYHLIDKANLLTLSAPEMTVLVGGLRVLATNFDGSSYGVFTKTPGVLTNDFFANLLDMGTKWTALDSGQHAYRGTDYVTGEGTWVGTRADLVFGSNSELRAVAEVYASDDVTKKFVDDFVAAWTKVMNLDRFELR
jgi:catalase-peroxidase